MESRKKKKVAARINIVKIRSTVKDQRGHHIYLTDKRCTTSATSTRKCKGTDGKLWKQFARGSGFSNPVRPQVYLYYRNYQRLTYSNTTIVVVVYLGYSPDGQENNFIMTAYQIRRQKGVRNNEICPYYLRSGRRPSLRHFGQPIAATGYQLSDQLLLRVDAQSLEAAGLTIFNFSIHKQGSQGIPLPGLSGALADNPLLLQTLASPPVSHFLKLVKRKQGTCALLRHPSLQEALVA